MTVLVIALDTQVRAALEAQLTVRNRAFECRGLEWLQANQASCSIPGDVSVVVNTLSLEYLDAGGEPDSALLSGLLQSCEQAAIPLLHLSSDQVFDGIDGGRNREDDPVAPASRIGAQLSRLEELVRTGCQRHIILRTGPLFSSQGDNVLTRLLQGIQQGEALSLSNAGKCCPLHSSDLARVVTAIIEQLACGAEPWGNYHYCSSDPASNYQFAETVLAVASQYSPVSEPSLQLESLEINDTSWSRPLLHCNKIRNAFGIKQLPWRTFISPSVKKFFDQQDPD